MACVGADGRGMWTLTPWVVGLDLSLTATGVARVGQGALMLGRLEAVTLKTAGRRGDTWVQRAERLRGVRERIDAFVGVPQLLVVEGPSYGGSMSSSASMHDRSGLWWQVIGPLLELGVPVAVASPKSRAKYACGSGNGDKKAVLASMRARFPDVVIGNDNEADALALACMGARWLGEPLDLAEGYFAAALGGVEWPELRRAA